RPSKVAEPSTEQPLPPERRRTPTVVADDPSEDQPIFQPSKRLRLSQIVPRDTPASTPESSPSQWQDPPALPPSAEEELFSEESTPQPGLPSALTEIQQDSQPHTPMGTSLAQQPPDSPESPKSAFFRESQPPEGAIWLNRSQQT